MIANGLQNETPLLCYNLPGLYTHHCDVISQLMACYSGLSFGDLRLSRNARWSLTLKPIRILCMSCSERIMSLLQSECLIPLSHFRPICPFLLRKPCLPHYLSYNSTKYLLYISTFTIRTSSASLECQPP